VESRDVSLKEKQDSSFEPTSRYWVPEGEARSQLHKKGWRSDWLIVFRDICRSTDERTTITTCLPFVGTGNTCPIILLTAEPRERVAALLGNLNAVVLDFIARLKVGGSHLTYNYLKQFAVLPPAYYSSTDISFINHRVVELVYTSSALKPLARDLGCDGPPFPWDDGRRAILRAELDAWYARAYGLTRDELRYILDPADVMGPDCPSETFRVLKTNEMKRYGEYRTRRLVLEAWDRMERGELPAPEPYDRRRSVHAPSTMQAAPAASAATDQGLLQFTLERPR